MNLEGGLVGRSGRFEEIVSPLKINVKLDLKLIDGLSKPGATNAGLGLANRPRHVDVGKVESVAHVLDVVAGVGNASLSGIFDVLVLRRIAVLTVRDLAKGGILIPVSLGNILCDRCSLGCSGVGVEASDEVLGTGHKCLLAII